MKVFIQVEDKCMGINVANKSSTGIDVIELISSADESTHGRTECNSKATLSPIER